MQGLVYEALSQTTRNYVAYFHKHPYNLNTISNGHVEGSILPTFLSTKWEESCKLCLAKTRLEEYNKYYPASQHSLTQSLEVTSPFWISLQTAIFVSLHGGPAVIDHDVIIAQLPPTILRQPVSHVPKEDLTGNKHKQLRMRLLKEVFSYFRYNLGC